jgi:hypothetical protein
MGVHARIASSSAEWGRCDAAHMHRLLSGELEVNVFNNLELSQKGDVMMIYKTGKGADVSFSLSYSCNKDAIDALVAFIYWNRQHAASISSQVNPTLSTAAQCLHPRAAQ